MQIVSGSRDKSIKLWNTLGECKYTIVEPEGHTEWVSCVRFSPITAQHIIVSAGYDCLVKVWSLTTCKLKNDLRGHRYYINTVTVSPDGSLCASGGKVRPPDLLFASTGLARLTNGGEKSLAAVPLSPRAERVYLTGPTSFCRTARPCCGTCRKARSCTAWKPTRPSTRCASRPTATGCAQQPSPPSRQGARCLTMLRQEGTRHLSGQTLDRAKSVNPAAVWFQALCCISQALDRGWASAAASCLKTPLCWSHGAKTRSCRSSANETAVSAGAEFDWRVLTCRSGTWSPSSSWMSSGRSLT